MGHQIATSLLGQAQRVAVQEWTTLCDAYLQYHNGHLVPPPGYCLHPAACRCLQGHPAGPSPHCPDPVPCKVFPWGWPHCPPCPVSKRPSPTRAQILPCLYGHSATPMVSTVHYHLDGPELQHGIHHLSITGATGTHRLQHPDWPPAHDPHGPVAMGRGTSCWSAMCRLPSSLAPAAPAASLAPALQESQVPGPLLSLRTWSFLTPRTAAPLTRLCCLARSDAPAWAPSVPAQPVGALVLPLPAWHLLPPRLPASQLCHTV